MTLRAQSVLASAIALVAVLGSARVALAGECATDDDCGHGFECETLMSGTGGASAGSGGSAVGGTAGSGGAGSGASAGTGSGFAPPREDFCGDGLCRTGETEASCALDCANTVCALAECDADDDCAEGYACEDEPLAGTGGASGPACGDGLCTSGETQESCAVDCTVTRRCAPDGGTCSSDTECAPGFYCSFLGNGTGGGSASGSTGAGGFSGASGSAGTSGSSSGGASSGGTASSTGGTGSAVGGTGGTLGGTGSGPDPALPPVPGVCMPVEGSSGGTGGIGGGGAGTGGVGTGGVGTGGVGTGGVGTGAVGTGGAGTAGTGFGGTGAVGTGGVGAASSGGTAGTETGGDGGVGGTSGGGGGGSSGSANGTGGTGTGAGGTGSDQDPDSIERGGCSIATPNGRAPLAELGVLLLVGLSVLRRRRQR
jgi:hypothetical protein